CSRSITPYHVIDRRWARTPVRAVDAPDGVQRTARPTYLHLLPGEHLDSLNVWISRSAKNCLTQFRNGYPTAAGSLSRSTAFRRVKTNCAAQALAMPCSPP